MSELLADINHCLNEVSWVSPTLYYCRYELGCLFSHMIVWTKMFVLFYFCSDFVWMGFTFISQALHVRVLTLSLPHWPCCHLKTASKVQHLKSEKWFHFHTSMSKELHLNAQYWSSLKYGTGKSSACRHVCALFCWKILPSVKGLIDNFQKWQVKIIWQCFDCGRVKSLEWRRQRRRADLQWF